MKINREALASARRAVNWQGLKELKDMAPDKKFLQAYLKHPSLTMVPRISVQGKERLDYERLKRWAGYIQ